MAKLKAEYDEMRVKLHLLELREWGGSILIKGKPITVISVKNNGKECGSIPRKINLLQMSDTDIEALAKEVGAFKAPAGSKADVFINDIGISVKSLRGAPSAFLNHTHRSGFVQVCQRVGTDIAELDEIIADYWEKRLTGIIGEDVLNNNPNSPFRNHYTYLKPILNYFIFTGSGRGDSKYPAQYILCFLDPFQENTWFFSRDEYLTDNWNNIKFSVRSKGIPSSYPNGANSAIIMPWVRWVNGRYKGSLHGRVV